MLVFTPEFFPTTWLSVVGNSTVEPSTLRPFCQGGFCQGIFGLNVSLFGIHGTSFVYLPTLILGDFCGKLV